MKIAFASCAKFEHYPSQPVWLEIQNEKPDVLILLGDNIYLDHNNHSDAGELKAELTEQYQLQLNEPHFKSLLADLKQRNGQLLVIYDDHDFLGNNRYGGDHAPDLRNAARQALVSAFDLSPQPNGDVYSKFQSPLVDVVLLDERFYRRSPQASRDDRDAILGAAQWTWLEAEVANSKAKPFLVVASSTTVHKYGDESWEQYPGALARLRKLLSGRRGALVISGDVHRNVLCDESGVLEIVSSGVARNGVIFGGKRKNYGILSFDDAGVRAQLKSLKAGGQFDVNILLDNWRL